MANGSRYFATILYPESCPIDITHNLKGLVKWLNDNCLIGCLSPLHEPDQDCPDDVIVYDDTITVDDDETEAEYNIYAPVRKPHYHMLLYFKGNRTLKSVKGLIKSPLNSGPVIAVASGGGMCRYFLHLNYSPEEKQRWPSTVRLTDFGGFDSDKFLLSPDEVQKMIIDLIDKYHISSMGSLLRFMYAQKFPSYAFNFVRRNVYLVNSVMRDWECTNFKQNIGGYYYDED